MTDSKSLKLKPAAAILMALALITTTFAGVSYAEEIADPIIKLTMQYGDSEAWVEYDSEGVDHGNMTTELYIYDFDGLLYSTGGEMLVNEGPEWYTHWADVSLFLFIEGNDTINPLAVEGIWYSMSAIVYDEDHNSIANTSTQICIEDDTGAACDVTEPTPAASWGESVLSLFDVDMDGNLTIDEYINGQNQMLEEPLDDMQVQMITAMFTSEDINGDSMLDVFELNNLYNTMNEQGEDNEYEMMMGMMDADGDGYLNITELSVMFSEDEAEDEEFDAASMLTMITNLFNFHDEDNDNMLDIDEMVELFEHMDRLDSEVCYAIAAGDVVFQEGEFWKAGDDGDTIILLDGDIAPDDGEFCFYTDNMDSEMLRFMLDTNGDNSLSSSEILARFNFDNDMTDVQLEYFDIAFKMSDSDGNELLNDSELRTFVGILDNYKDDGNAGEEELFDGCVDAVNRVPIDFNKTDCMAANYQWMGERDDQDAEHNEADDQETRPDDDIRFNEIDVWFEQWDDQTIELVIVELAVLDDQDEIDRLVKMADAEYGNNDSTLNQAEVDMLIALYAMTLNPDDMANGLTLDGQNGTAVDFWVEVDGLLDESDVVFVRIGTVIAFPTTAYDNSTTHTFTVAPDMEEGEHSESQESVSVEDECDRTSVWIHNSDTWNVKTATGFTHDETNDVWYELDEDCRNHGEITFELEKKENGKLPVEENEDWTWEEEEMNMFPICKWYYSVTFANGTSMEEERMGDAPKSGDYLITLVDDASYDIYVSCWDPESGKMVVDISSPLGNSSNTSIGEAMGHVSFKLPAGTGGNISFGVTWTDGYHTESGTLTVVATGDGTVDLSDIDVDSKGVLPGFTVGLGVIAMLGAAMIAGRRNQA